MTDRLDTETAAPAGDPVAGPSLGPRGAARAKALAGSALLLLSLGLAGVMLVPGLLGYQRYVITGGSMSGSIDRGSLLYGELVPNAELKVGDVITYTPPPGAGPTTLVTHRIVWEGTDRAGTASFRTKGDANAKTDPWTFVLREPEQARAVFSIPYIGYAFSALAERWVRMLVIGVPAALIALSVLAGLWRDAGRDVREGAGEPAAGEASTS